MMRDMNNQITLTPITNSLFDVKDVKDNDDKRIKFERPKEDLPTHLELSSRHKMTFPDQSSGSPLLSIPVVVEI
jgi:hypothetical protein